MMQISAASYKHNFSPSQPFRSERFEDQLQIESYKGRNDQDDPVTSAMLWYLSVSTPSEASHNYCEQPKGYERGNGVCYRERMT